MGTVCELSVAVQGTEQDVEQATPATPEAAVVQAADEAAKAEEEAKAQLQEEANSVLKDAAKAFRKGESEYGKGMLQAGGLSWEYTLLRMRLTGMGRKTMEVAYAALEGEFAKWASSKVRVDVLVRASMAHRLFSPFLPTVKAKGKDVPVDLAYGHWRDAWCQLIELNLADGTWAIPALVADEAVAEFKRATEAGMSREESVEVVKTVQRKLAQAQADIAREEAEDKAREAQEAKQEHLEAKVELNDRTEECHRAEAAVLAARDDAERAERTAKAKAAQEALLAAQRAEKEAQAKKDAEEREAARKAADAKKAADREARRQDREAQREAKAVNAGPIEPVQGAGLKAMAKQGTAKDVAGMMVELLAGADAPDDVLEAFLCMAKASGSLCKGSIVSVAL